MKKQQKMQRFKKRQHTMMVVLVLVLAMGIAGCGPKTAVDGKNPTTQSSPTSSTAKQTTYPLTVTDASDTVLTFDKAPERVVTLAPSETETIYAIGAADKLFGVDKYSNYPEEAKAKPPIGDLNGNLEAVIAANPDLIFAGKGVNKKIIDKLRELNLKVYASDPKTIDQVIEKVETVGVIMNLQENAHKVAEKMRAEKKQVVDLMKSAPKKRVYLEFSPGWTVGDGEFLSELVDLAGGANVATGKKGWYPIDPEAIIKANPEVILYTKSGGMGQYSILDEINKRSGWDQMDAMKNKQVFGLDSDPLVRVGPRITQGLLEVAKAVHPELVK